MKRSIVETTEGLKDIATSWLRDPCFDLSEMALAEGYQELEKEIRLYELKWTIKWDNDYLDMLIKCKDQFNPITRAFEMDKTRKTIADNTDKVFELSGLMTMDYTP